MEIHYIERGRFQGRIDVPRSIQTMSRGETWHINPSCIKMQTVRNCCSLANTSTDRLYTVSCPGFTEPCITVKRLK